MICKSPELILFILLMFFVSVAFSEPVKNSEINRIEQHVNKKMGKRSDMISTHPGFILNVEYPGGKETKKSVNGVPLKNQFIFLKDGREVQSIDQADTAIPIVRVEVTYSEDRKKILEINEKGPDGQSLRRTYAAP